MAEQAKAKRKKSPVKKAAVKKAESTRAVTDKGIKADGFVAVKYTKQDVIAEMASQHGYTKVQADRHLTDVIDSIASVVEKLKTGVDASGKLKSDKLIFLGFMGFEITRRKARKGWDNFGHKVISVPAKNVIKLTAGNGLREIVEGESIK